MKNRKRTGAIIVLGFVMLFLTVDLAPVKAVDYISVEAGDKFDFTYTIDAENPNAYTEGNKTEEMFFKSVKTSMGIKVEIKEIYDYSGYSNITYSVTYQVNWTDSGQSSVNEVNIREVSIYENHSKSVFVEQNITSPWDLFFINSISGTSDQTYENTSVLLGTDTTTTNIYIIWGSNGVLKQCTAKKRMNVTRESVNGGLLTMEIDAVIILAPKSQQVPGYSTVVLVGCASFSVVVVILMIRKKARISLEKPN